MKVPRRLAFPASQAWGPYLIPGKYEITAKVEMTGIPDCKPPQITTQCLSEKAPVPSAPAGAQRCIVMDMNTEGNTVTYTMGFNHQSIKTESGSVSLSKYFGYIMKSI